MTTQPAPERPRPVRDLKLHGSDPRGGAADHSGHLHSEHRPGDHRGGDHRGGEHRGRLRHSRHGWLGALGSTAFLLGLIALSIESVAGDLAIVLVVSVLVMVGLFHWMFPGSEFFTLALANFIGVYASLFVLFVVGNFNSIGPVPQAVGFLLPLVAFVGGAWWRRDTIRNVVLAQRFRDGGIFGRIFVWMVPVTIIGALTFLVPGRDFPPSVVTEVFLAAMAAIALIVLFVSRDIAIFLLDTGLLFEGFFQQSARLVIPAFAFLTFYSLLVIIFASAYTILDRLMIPPNFLINGVARDITYPESLYFSIVTLSTVGYGDIQPHTGPVRVIAAIEIVFGVLLLLFGFSAIIGHSHARERRDHDQI